MWCKEKKGRALDSCFGLISPHRCISRAYCTPISRHHEFIKLNSGAAIVVMKCYCRGGVDLCPENDEQPVPKSLVRLMKRAESISNPKNKKKKGEVEESTGSVGESGASEQDVGEGRESRGRRGAREGPMFSKRNGESLKGYLERVDMESNARIMDTFRKNRKPSDRRKKYVINSS